MWQFHSLIKDGFERMKIMKHRFVKLYLQSMNQKNEIHTLTSMQRVGKMKIQLLRNAWL